jgi:hypothetical protein
MIESPALPGFLFLAQARRSAFTRVFDALRP